MKAYVVCLLVTAVGWGVDARAQATPPSLAILPLDAKLDVPAAVTDLLTDNLANEVRATKVFGRVIGPQEVATLMPAEQRKVIQMCASDECALVDQEIAGALGTTHLLVGNVGRLGSSFLLNLRLLDLRTAEVLSTVSERLRGESQEILLDAVRPSVIKLFVGAKLMQPPAPEQPPPSTESSGSMAPLAVRVAGGVGLGLTVLPALVAGALWATVGGLAVYDLAGGYRPGGRHVLTGNQAMLSNVAFLGAASASLLVLVVAIAASTALVTSWIL